MSITHKPKAGPLLTGTEYEAADAHEGAPTLAEVLAAGNDPDEVPIVSAAAVQVIVGDPTFADAYSISYISSAPGEPYIDLYAQDDAGATWSDLTLGQDGNAILTGSHNATLTADIDALVTAGEQVILTGDGATVIVGLDILNLVCAVQIDINTGSLRLIGLPTSDPGVAGQVYSNGAPSAGNPKALMVSGG